MRRIGAFALAGLLCAGLTAARAEDKKGTEVELGGLKSKAPAGWKSEQPAGPAGFRAYQFQIPHAEGDGRDGELIVFYFGEAGAGSVEQNVQRQLDAFIPPEGKTIADASKVEKLQVGGRTVTYVDVQGTHKYKARPMDAKYEARPNSRELYAILETPKGPYYIRLVGPAKTVEKNKAGFDEFVKGFK
jgi:hypothetical protein